MESTAQGIPIIDLAPIAQEIDHDSLQKIATRIASACEDAGCFYVINHGVESDLLKSAMRDLKIFFTQSIDYKSKFIDPNSNVDRGYEPFETRNVNAFMGKMGLPNDPLEKYAFGPPPGFIRSVPENIWPDVPSTLKINVENCYDQIRRLAEKLMKLFSIGARAPNENFFFDQCHEGEHILRANFYPKHIAPKPMQNNRFGEHTDSTPFTILAMDESRDSLQIKNSVGEWIPADPIENAFFVNLGDFMQIWTNGKWKATVHRVVWPGEEMKDDRLSLIFFLLMNPGAIAECLPSCVEPGEEPKYRPTSHADYINARMNRLAGRY